MYGPDHPYTPRRWAPPRQPIPRPTRRGSAARSLLLGAILGVLLVCFLAGSAMAAYGAIALTLPAPEELRTRTAAFRSTEILDRYGRPLYVLNDPQGGRRTVVPLSAISPWLIRATLATEDPHFYLHPGVDPVGVARALYYDLRYGAPVVGGSTIPQQLVKLAFLSPERTLERKVKEAVLAAEVSRRYPKDTILELYLNEIHYGNLAYGAEAAAQVYFGKPAADLTLAEASFLAGIPQAPARYDPYTNFAACKARQEVVLGLMVKHGFASAEEAARALAEPLRLAPRSASLTMRAPHFTVYVREQLEARYGPQALYRNGLRVVTTLDLDLQAAAEDALRKHLTTLADHNAHNGAVVVLDPTTGEILALVGSADFWDEAIDGQVNMALSPRQPGSAIKPLTYLAAFERGWTPATLIWDVPTEFPDGANPPYRPRNYDGAFHGPVLVRQALGNSLNIPAVKALQFVGLDGLKEMAARMGITTLVQDDYGLSLTLGGGEVSLLELVNAYAVLASGGVYRPPVSILRVEDSAGRLLEEHQPSPGRQVISPEHAFLITDILADPQARQPAFGSAARFLELDRPAAVKTGTTNDVRDVWAVGYTPDLVAGVWVGNADNSAMTRLSGATGAAPIWQAVMLHALRGKPPRAFEPPPGVERVEICAEGGTLPGPACPARRLEWFAKGQGPRPASEDIHQVLRVDRTTGMLATEFCPPEVVEERVYLVYPPEAAEWARERGLPEPPREPCSLHAYAAELAITSPQEGEVVQGVVPIWGTVRVPGLAAYRVEYGIGPDPGGWGPVAGPFAGEVRDAPLAQWDTRGLADMEHTLRLVAETLDGRQVEARVHVLVRNATPTAMPSPIPTATETPWPTTTPTEPPTWETPALPITPSPTEGPWETPTTEPTQEPVTPTPAPTEPPPPLETPVPSPTEPGAPGGDATPTALPPLVAHITAPLEGQAVSPPVQIRGTAAGSAFVAYRVEMGLGTEPTEWVLLGEERPVQVVDGVLARWRPRGLSGQVVTLRLTVWGVGQWVEDRVTVWVE
ncbi:MAG: PBP1A family penicillin-binding protein [Anaerolineae bacterium]